MSYAEARRRKATANGETPLKVLAPALYEFFGLDTKECYRYYSAMKLRKNPSRTYFIDKMQKKLNEKIRRDEELTSSSSFAPRPFK